ncbi:copper metallochaperone [Vibrio ponticus]|nr:copper metallochaperone [Vibrio ponticus]
MKLKPLLLASLLLSPLANAEHLMLHNPYARATPPNAATSAVFVEIMNHAKRIVPSYLRRHPQLEKLNCMT